MSRKRILATNGRKEPEELPDSTRQGRRVSVKPPRVKTSSRGKTRNALRPKEEHEGETPFANEDIQPRIAEREC